MKPSSLVQRCFCITEDCHGGIQTYNMRKGFRTNFSSMSPLLRGKTSSGRKGNMSGLTLGVKAEPGIRPSLLMQPSCLHGRREN